MQDIYHRRWQMPGSRWVRSSVHSMSLTSKTLWYIALIIFVCSTLALLWSVNNAFTTRVPIKGGTLHEGVIGVPRFINPVLAINDASKDVGRLVYAGLMKETPTKEITTDLAESYEISPDGKVYTVRILPDATFHDGTPVRAHDVVYTVRQILDPVVKSPHRNNWLGITPEAVDEHTVRFTLRQPYPDFLWLLTVGILPEHLWGSLSADEFPFSPMNIQPIGAGPYKISSIVLNDSGIPTSYTLKRYKDYVGEPHLLSTINFTFFSDEAEAVRALELGQIDSLGAISSDAALELGDKRAIVEGQLPRIFSLFFNHNQARVFLHPEVKQALVAATDVESIIDDVFSGHAIAVNSPLPLAADHGSTTPEDRIAQASQLLEDAGWVRGEDGVYALGGERLAFSIATSDTAELKETAELLKEQWATIGAQVEVRVYETGDLNQRIISKRNFDTLLFGHIVTRPSDLYAFWHSSQRTDPGLNIAQYTNARVDAALEQIRGSASATSTVEALAVIQREVAKDIPALFLYSPSYIYAVPSSLGGIQLGTITESSDRFANLSRWYRESDRLWTIFARNQ
jgi:peptide/nickel transport system substrate-binding protein